jgi:hypothetical protein
MPPFASAATLNRELVPSSLVNLSQPEQIQVLVSNPSLRNQILLFYQLVLTRANSNTAGYCNLQAPWNTSYTVLQCQMQAFYLIITEPQNGGLASIIQLAKQIN